MDFQGSQGNQATARPTADQITNVEDVLVDYFAIYGQERKGLKKPGYHEGFVATMKRFGSQTDWGRSTESNSTLRTKIQVARGRVLPQDVPEGWGPHNYPSKVLEFIAMKKKDRMSDEALCAEVHRTFESKHAKRQEEGHASFT
ncbi:hypothetical protein MMC14_009672 [Varicellaria rhodocarpa]|nr:hypothetical protein [Varicellaria rhodocarpa]